MKTAGMVMSSVPSPLIENGIGVLLGESLGEVETDEGTGSRLSGGRERKHNNFIDCLKLINS